MSKLNAFKPLRDVSIELGLGTDAPVVAYEAIVAFIEKNETLIQEGSTPLIAASSIVNVRLNTEDRGYNPVIEISYTTNQYVVAISSEEGFPKRPAKFQLTLPLTAAPIDYFKAVVQYMYKIEEEVRRGIAVPTGNIAMQLVGQKKGFAYNANLNLTDQGDGTFILAANFTESVDANA